MQVLLIDFKIYNIKLALDLVKADKGFFSIQLYTVVGLN